MPTDKQIQASRTNGARSKGPVTEEGKKNSSRNSTRHGLLAATVVLDQELVEPFHELLISLMDEYQPRSPTQLMLVETMAVARWRQMRVWGVQKMAMDRDMALQDPNVGPAQVRAAFAFRGSPESSCNPEVLLRYEIAFDRQFIRALTRLTVLQSKRSASQPAPYHPESPAGQTWKDAPPSNDSPTAERTQEVVDSLESARVEHPSRIRANRVAGPSGSTSGILKEQDPATHS